MSVPVFNTVVVPAGAGVSKSLTLGTLTKILSAHDAPGFYHILLGNNMACNGMPAGGIQQIEVFPLQFADYNSGMSVTKYTPVVGAVNGTIGPVEIGLLRHLRGSFLLSVVGAGVPAVTLPRGMIVYVRM